MTKLEAKRKLEQACELIFDVEKQFVEGEFPRLFGYRARIALATFQDNIGYSFFTQGEDLTKQKSVSQTNPNQYVDPHDPDGGNEELGA